MCGTKMQKMAAVFTIGSILIVYLSQLTDAKELHWCGTGNRDLKIPDCDCGEAIYIRSAIVGFSEEWKSKPLSCPRTGTTCVRTVTNHPVIRKCNENSIPSCWIPLDILWFSTSDKLCDDHRNGNFIHITYDCVNSGFVLYPKPRVIHQCRLDTDTDQYFSIQKCPCNQVIHVRSAEVGFSDRCSQNVDCTRPTSHPQIMNCNGQNDCSMKTNVLLYSDNLWLCDKHKDGNFINITYDCVNEFTFRGCRAADNDSKHVFTIDTCQLTGQVIYIHSTYVGFSANWNATDNRPECPGKPCKNAIPTHDEIKMCNGKHNCSFSQNVFNFTETKGCPNATTANFIFIKYSCFNDPNAATTTTLIEDATKDVTSSTDQSAKKISDDSGLQTGALAVIIVLSVLLLLLLIAFIVVVICFCRRSKASKVNNEENLQVENAPNTYEMSVDDDHEYASVDIQSEASAPARYGNGTDGKMPPSASVLRSSNDMTLVDNDLYQ